MKRIIAIILSMILFIMLAGCTENDNIKENSSTAETITETIYKQRQQKNLLKINSF